MRRAEAIAAPLRRDPKQIGWRNAPRLPKLGSRAFSQRHKPVSCLSRDSTKRACREYWVDRAHGNQRDHGNDRAEGWRWRYVAVPSRIVALPRHRRQPCRSRSNMSRCPPRQSSRSSGGRGSTRTPSEVSARKGRGRPNRHRTPSISFGMWTAKRLGSSKSNRSARPSCCTPRRSHRGRPSSPPTRAKPARTRCLRGLTRAKTPSATGAVLRPPTSRLVYQRLNRRGRQRGRVEVGGNALIIRSVVNHVHAAGFITPGAPRGAGARRASGSKFHQYSAPGGSELSGGPSGRPS